MAKCTICGSTIKSKRKKYCSKKCAGTKIPKKKKYWKPPTYDISEHNFKSTNIIIKKKRKCTRCGRKYIGRNTVQCVDCWRKYTKGSEEGLDIVDLSGFGTTYSEP